MTQSAPILYAPQTDAPIYPADPVTLNGRTLSAATALRRYLPADITAAGYRFPGPADAHREAERAITERAEALQITAAGGYAWPEAAAWRALEDQARAHLADPAAPIGPDLAADLGAEAADPAAAAARAGGIVAKADAFRAARGAIVRWRRAAIEGLAATAANGGDIAAINAARDAALAQAAEGIPA